MRIGRRSSKRRPVLAIGVQGACQKPLPRNPYAETAQKLLEQYNISKERLIDCLKIQHGEKSVPPALYGAE
jgi:hypothetical protein